MPVFCRQCSSLTPHLVMLVASPKQIMPESTPPTPNDDDALVQAVRQTGSHQAFAQLCLRHQHTLQHITESVLDSKNDAQDATQDALLRAWLNLDALADPSKFGPWLYRIGFACAIDLYRKRRRDHHHTRQEEALNSTLPETRSSNPLDAQAWTQLLIQSLAKLPERQRVPLLLFHLDGLNYTSLAKHLDQPEGTVRSTVTRARQRLQALFPNHSEDIPAMAHAVFQEQSRTLLTSSNKPIKHIMNGDAAADRLRASGIADNPQNTQASKQTITVWCDVLHEGRTPLFSGKPWHQSRAEHLASMGFGSVESLAQRMQGQDKAWENADQHETVLWFEHDLYDQLLLIRHLHTWAQRHGVKRSQQTSSPHLSLICIGDYPGIDRFIGLGQLEPDQIASLLGSRQQVLADQITLGQRVWQDFCSPNPELLSHWLTQDTSRLPYLHAAIRRHLQQYPSTENGLSRTEQAALTTLKDGPQTGIELFRQTQRMEEHPFLGDGVFYHHVDRLARESTPPLRINTPKAVADTVIELTGFGTDLLQHRADRVAVNGLDRWLGGVHLKSGTGKLWRWDQADDRLAQIPGD